MNKRKADDSYVESSDLDSLDCLKSKKNKLNNNWISGTTVANYLNGEPLLDWLGLYYNDYHFNEKMITRSSSKKNHDNPVNTKARNEMLDKNPLLSNGLLFEKAIYDDLQEKYGEAFYKVFENDGSTLDYDALYKETLKQVESRRPIIAQAVLVNKDAKIRGTADLLVRSDFINKIFKKDIIDPSDYKKNDRTYYFVIDIKWTSMTLCVDGKTIRNDGRFKAYKGQLYIYNYLIGKIQGYIPPIALIMAKNWKIDSRYEAVSGNSCYDLAGIIDYMNRDNIFIKKTLEAINWINMIHLSGLNYSPLNPTIKEMCVNASNYNDNGWNNVKKEILKKTNDITQVWRLTQKHRDYAFDKNIKKWNDDDCTTQNLNMSKTKTSETIDKILQINKQDYYKLLPNNLKDIRDNRFNWKKKFPSDFFIDFETLSEQVSQLDKIDIYDSTMNTQIIFMIGVGYELNDKFHYKCFRMETYDLDEERRILSEFKDFIDALAADLDHLNEYHPRLFHWSNAEVAMLENAFKRHSGLEKMWTNHIEWVDLCDIFTNEPIVVKGALCFKLKDIAKAMYSHGLISTSWGSSEISDGLNALMYGMKYYKSPIKTDEEIKIMEHITEYNKIDCKVLWEILTCIRGL